MSMEAVELAEYERKWPEATPAQRWELIHLSRVLGLDAATISWKEQTTKLGRVGFGAEQLRKVTETHFLSPEEKQKMRQKVMARVYEGLRGTPAEEYYRSLVEEANPHSGNRENT